MFYTLISTSGYSQLPQLEKPFRVEAAGKVIDLPASGHAAPFVFDYNGDGKKDIIIGSTLPLCRKSFRLSMMR
ncbi:hypothetical protein MASR2M69_20090 [Bacteroidota bacterium]